MNYCKLLNNGRWSGGPSHGAGLYASGTDVVVTDCMFTNNRTRSYAYSAGIHLASGTLVVTNSVFLDNRAAYGRGVAVYMASTATLVNCVFSGNEDYACNNAANSYGGALAVYVGASTTVTVENCTLADNYAKNDGGAVFVGSGKLVVKNSIFRGNIADDQYASPGDGGDTMYNDAGNGAVMINYSCLDGTGTTQLANDDFTLSNVITNNPLFALEYSDLHLKSEFGRWVSASGGWTNDADDVLSPCIDAGDPTSDYSLEPVENRGRINLGAYGNTGRASKSPPNPGMLFLIL